jgi:hypothetical protein
MFDVSWNLAFNCNISVSGPGKILIEFALVVGQNILDWLYTVSPPSSLMSVTPTLTRVFLKNYIAKTVEALLSSSLSFLGGSQFLTLHWLQNLHSVTLCDSYHRAPTPVPN